MAGQRSAETLLTLSAMLAVPCRSKQEKKALRDAMSAVRERHQRLVEKKHAAEALAEHSRRTMRSSAPKRVRVRSTATIST
ncbi:MAG: hypothetical protein DDT39_00019 [Firmicutes bacterium]|nr:hypothetical protein [candidate division NPL-UPA2 bacterium]